MIGRTLAHYEITGLLGKGGMGEVYRARDTKLDRDVAIKVLPEAFTHDRERLLRFEREAKLLASLAHGNIASIYGLHTENGTHFLAMELVAGADLAQRMLQGRLEPIEAFHISAQVASALEVAHEQGIVHRDIKPSNVIVSSDGKAKVLDFGLARSMESGTSDAGSLTQSPTMTSPATMAGEILGTAGYMSPEQVRGKPADHRADIWAFGCVLFEMLTGTRPFVGETISDTIAKVLEREPELDLLPRSVPRSMRTLLRRCLEKDPAKRLQAIGDARIAIQEYLDNPTPTDDTDKPNSAGRFLPWALLPLVAIGTWILKPSTTRRAIPTLSVEVPLPKHAWFLSPGKIRDLALSRDGRLLVFRAGELSADAPGSPDPDEQLSKPRLFLRRLDQSQARPIAGTESAHDPFFSPDGEWVGFVPYEDAYESQVRVLKKVPLDGGDPVSVATLGRIPVMGFSWSAGGTIAIGSINSGLLHVPAAGGDVDTLTFLDETLHEISHRLPHFLPDGRTVLYTAVSHHIDIINWDRDAKIYAFSLDTQERKLLIEEGSDARYLTSGHVVYALDGQLKAAPFDLPSLEVTGPAVPVLEGVGHCVNSYWAGLESGAAQFAVSENGLLAYVPGPVQAATENPVVWVDRTGEEEPIPLPPASYGHPRISADGSKLLISNMYKPLSAWIFDVERRVTRRQTWDGNQQYAVWGPGPEEITFDSDVEGPRYVFINTVDSDDGSGRKRIWEGQNLAGPAGTHVGRQEALVVAGTGSEWIISSVSDDSESIILRGPRSFPSLSASGEWLAYSSAHTGRSEVYARRYPDGARETLISAEGGIAPVWSRGESEIFYRMPEVEGEETRHMAVSVEIDADRILPGKPRELFRGFYLTGNPLRNYDVGPDGRFVVIKSTPDSTLIKLRETQISDHIRLVQNWFEVIHGKMSDKR